MLRILPILLFAGVAAGDVSFNRDIRPILTRHCTACHGGVKEAGDISFIYRAKAIKTGDSGQPAIVPGKPELSEMVRRINSTDPDEVMPQPKHGPPLSPEEIDLIERWIAAGASWEEHWAFVPPRDDGPPKTAATEWPTVSLDHYVLARLEKEKLAPSPEAPPAEWLRRATFDLTGVPPTPDELAAFEAAMAGDPDGARAEVSDRLLASPSFGERWATMWLDLARYADTYGFEKDPHRDIWPWRDWVIRAFNEDMPFDRFTIEQLAGDLLPEPTADQRLATAFHRNTQTNTEGGTDDEEFRVAAVIDRVSTTWTVWQATTFGCVQCHAHPYDPFEHDEFYEFTAFFNNTEDTDLDNDFPKMRVARDSAQREEASRLELDSRERRSRLNEDGRSLGESIRDWKHFVPDRFEPSHGKLVMAEGGAIKAEGTLPVRAVHKVSGSAVPFSALRLRILPDSDDPKDWPERGAFVNRFEVDVIAADGGESRIAMREVFADFLAGPHEPVPGGMVGDFPKLHGPRWFVFVPEEAFVPAPDSSLRVTMVHSSATTGSQNTAVRHFSIELSNDPGWLTLTQDPGRLEVWQELAEIRERLEGIPSVLVPVMLERPAEGLRETRVFARGNRLSKEHPVKPRLPGLLADVPKGAAATRLEMAEWLVDGNNPLTARVTANRLWFEMFGIGIVETVEDFGTSGTQPVDLALLDHLALRFQNEHRWSVKAFLREIVLSSTYRQTHRADPELTARDPKNQWFARGPRNRLGAEMIRDQALAAAGLLSPKMHGPPVYPPQPEGVWSTVYSGMSWNESTGEDRYRRGIYTYLRRTSGFPGFLTFDAPSRDLCSARRIATNTPLQALVTLNDPAHLEAAKALADRLAAHSPDLRERIAHGSLIVSQRVASAAMLDELAALHADAEEEYTRHPEESAKLADSPEQAALVLVANTLLNLDSALTR